MAKVSGPLLDRIDMHIEVPAVPFEELSASADGTSSATMRDLVTRVRTVQRTRYGVGTTLNGQMGTRELRKFCALDDEGRKILRGAMDQLGLSARAHDRILRVARTIADMDGAAMVRAEHIVEAIGYRSLDRKLWQK